MAEENFKLIKKANMNRHITCTKTVPSRKTEWIDYMKNNISSDKKTCLMD